MELMLALQNQPVIIHFLETNGAAGLFLFFFILELNLFRNQD
jgi:hypothetical protein